MRTVFKKFTRYLGNLTAACFKSNKDKDQVVDLPGASLSTIAQMAPVHSHDGQLVQFRHWRRPTYVKFINKTPYTVKTYWLNYDGGEKEYHTLAPRYGVREMKTFCTHPWTFRAEVDGMYSQIVVAEDCQVFYPTGMHPQTSPQEVYLRLPTIPEWTYATHLAHAPKRFQATVRAVLLAHHHLQAKGDHLAAELQVVSTARGRMTRRRISTLVGLEQAYADLHSRTLGALPLDLVLAIIQLAAPPCEPYIKPIDEDPEVLSDAAAAAAALQAAAAAPAPAPGVQP